MDRIVRPPGLDKRRDLGRFVSAGSPIARERDADLAGVAAQPVDSVISVLSIISLEWIAPTDSESANIRSAIAKIGEARRRRGMDRPGADELQRGNGADAAEHASSDRRRRPTAAVFEDPGDLCACRAAVAHHSGAADRLRPRASMRSPLSQPRQRCPWRPAPCRPRARTPWPRPRSCRPARPAIERAPPHSGRPSA
jgi:hypothetical protein